MLRAARAQLSIFRLSAAGLTRGQYLSDFNGNPRPAGTVFIVADSGAYPPATGCRCDGTQANPAGPSTDTSGNDSSGTDISNPGYTAPIDPSNPPPKLIDFHPAGKNFLYMDGHVDNAKY